MRDTPQRFSCIIPIIRGILCSNPSNEAITAKTAIRKRIWISKTKKNCPKCKSNLIPLNCSQEEFQEYSPEEKEIIIESSLLQERTKNKHLQCAIKNPKLSPEEQIQKIANDVTVIKWSILGFAGICVLIYLFEEFL